MSIIVVIDLYVDPGFKGILWSGTERGEVMDTYLITGATGYIGSMMAEKLVSEGHHVILLVRSPEKLKASLRQKAGIVVGDVCDAAAWDTIGANVDYVIHCAAPTGSAYMAAHPVETAETIIEGTRNALEFARRCENCRLLFLSSMEIYGSIESTNDRRVTEDKFGYIDLLLPRSAYPVAKRMAEHMCFAYYEEYGVQSVIARLAQTFGRGVLASDHRVFAQFADSVRNGKDIILHTEGKSVGNYCDIDDVLAALAILLEKGVAGQAYNVVNEKNTMTIREMAELVADKIANHKINVVFDIPKDDRYGYAANTGLRLSGEKLRKLGWEAKVSLEQMYRNMLK